MRPLRAILRRELLATFATPVAYVTMGLVATLLGAIFAVTTLRTGEPASLRAVLLAAGWMLLAAAPAIAMRSFSEEFRQGTWETLLAAPIRPWHAVLGKFLSGAILIASLVVLPAIACGLVLELYANPDWGEIASGVGGLVLAGTAFLAIGILASTLTANQLVAFLVPVFALFAVALGGRVLASAVPAEWAPLAFGLDPLRRVEDFVLGLVDTANIVYFVAVTAAALAVASVSLGSIREGGFGGRSRHGVTRFLARVESFLFACGAFVAALAIAALCARPSLRAEFDATKTRAYTLSEATTSMVAGLKGDWRIAVLVSEDRADPAALRRLDEVLDRMSSANPFFVTERIDPDDPAASNAYEALLEHLTAANRATIDRWEPALERAFAGYQSLKSFARTELPSLRTLIGTLDPNDPSREQVARIAAGLAQLTELDGATGQGFVDAVRELLRTAADRPLPDWDGARSALVANDRLWSDQFAAAAALFGQWARNASLAPALRGFARDAEARYEAQAKERRAEQYELEELPPLEIGEIGRVIGAGEAAIVMGPSGAVAVPSWQIVPAHSAGGGRATLGFDVAGRAEQVLAGAVRSLTITTMPMVLFVHAEPTSVLARSQDHNDVAAMADALRTARYVVREWSVVAEDRPAPPRGQRAVWVVVPPLKREGLQTSDREKRLIDATQRLIADGEPVLVTFARNLLPLFGQKDPWDAVATKLGIAVETGKVILELVPLSEDRSEIQPWQAIEHAERSHPIGAALDGQTAVLNHPTPMSILPGTVGAHVISSVEPQSDRWIEDDWREDSRSTREVPAAKRFEQPQPVVIATAGTEPTTGRIRRSVAVGSGGWLLSTIADVTQSLGGSRFTIANPGNRELLLASVAWLSGEEALVAGGGTGREVSRVAVVSDGARGAWLAVLGLGMPGGIAALGIAVWFRRRGDH
ncbi:MAG: ABC transporter permease [Phycisphaerae bacterium]|nr:ABC transporter permease [Phycisphaerae bacterium]